MNLEKFTRLADALEKASVLSWLAKVLKKALVLQIEVEKNIVRQDRRAAQLLKREPARSRKG